MYVVKMTNMKGFGKLKNYFKLVETGVEADIKKLGDETSVKMKEIIHANKVRPQTGPTTLENAIDTEHFETLDGVGWGVGNISKLNQEAKHWRAVNYGSDHLVDTNIPPGPFSPGPARPSSSAFRAGRLQPEKKGGAGGGIRVSNPIPPMNYIQKTMNFVNRQIQQIQSRLRRK